MLKKWALILVLLALPFLGACSYLDSRAYYADRTVTSQEVRSQWGEPISTELLPDGSMRWTYFEKDNWYYAEVWFIFRDGKVVESGVK